jgi:uncharacterized protein YneR
MKLFRFTFVTLIPALAVAQTTCTDNATFKFNHDDTDELMGCDWLTKDNAEDRKAKYCVRGPIKGACLASCDFCLCEDRSSFTFDLDNGNKQQDCKWFGLRNTDKRRATYCNHGSKDDVAGFAIGAACVNACGFCTPAITTPPQPQSPLEDDSSSWKFIVMSDLHSFERYAPYPDDYVLYNRQESVLSKIHDNYGGDLIILPGDTQQGNWNVQSWIDKHFPGLSAKEAVYQAGVNCYSTMRKLFADSGYGKILVAIGDHELGDNYWAPNDSKTLSIPDFRKSFTDALYRDSDGKYIFENGFIGTAPPTPYGTPFEYTSFAHVHKSVLFVTVDVYYQISNTLFFHRSEGLGGEGVITGDVAGSHLEWFEHVLQQAEKDPTIKHIIVQAHVPILNPVRKVSSSAMFFDRGENSPFWKLMVKYGVDLYFAGEVHANTVLKDNNSDLLQVVSSALGMEGFLRVLVTDDSLTIEAFNEIGPLRIPTDKHYTLHGMLKIQKFEVGEAEISSSGVLHVMDIQKPIIQFRFDRLYDMSERVLGLHLSEVVMQSTTLTKVVPNYGEFDQQYDAQVGGVEIREGGVSGSAGYFNGASSKMGIYSFGPLVAGSITSYSVWIKTESIGEMVLVHYDRAWSSGVNAQKNMFSLTLDNGKPVLYSSKTSTLKPLNSGMAPLNDGGWHQVAVSMPSSGCRLSQVKMFIDGKPIATSVKNDDILFFVGFGGLSVGGTGFSYFFQADFPSWKPYTGLLDEVNIWSRTIWLKDLKKSPMKNFVSNAQNCKEMIAQGTKIRSVIDLKKKRQCEKKCKKAVPCLGFEAAQIGDTVTCKLFLHGTPEFFADEADTAGTQCGILLS